MIFGKKKIPNRMITKSDTHHILEKDKNWYKDHFNISFNFIYLNHRI